MEAAAGATDVWLSASADITPKEPTSGTTIHFTGQWVDVYPQGGNGIPDQITAPNSEVVFSSNATSAATSYTGGQWVTTVPLGSPGNVFVGGVTYRPRWSQPR